MPRILGIDDVELGTTDWTSANRVVGSADETQLFVTGFSGGQTNPIARFVQGGATELVFSLEGGAGNNNPTGRLRFGPNATSAAYIQGYREANSTTNSFRFYTILSSTENLALVIAATGAHSIGLDGATNPNLQAHQINGGLNAGGTGTSAQSRSFLINANAYNAANFSRARVTGIGGANIQFLTDTVDSNSAIVFGVNLAADGATTPATTAGAITAQGVWQIGPSAGLGTTRRHTIFGSIVNEANGVTNSLASFSNAGSVEINTNVYTDGTNTRRGIANVTGYSIFSLQRNAAPGSTALSLDTNYQDAQTANNVLTTTNTRTILSATMAGAFQFGRSGAGGVALSVEHLFNTADVDTSTTIVTARTGISGTSTLTAIGCGPTGGSHRVGFLYSRNGDIGWLHYNNGLNFLYNPSNTFVPGSNPAGSTLQGSVSTAGAWTLGPVAAGVTHTLWGTTQINTVAGGATFFSVSGNNPLIANLRAGSNVFVHFQFGASGADAFAFRTSSANNMELWTGTAGSGTQVGTIASAWTLGPSGAGASTTHTVNGRMTWQSSETGASAVYVIRNTGATPASVRLELSSIGVTASSTQAVQFKSGAAGNTVTWDLLADGTGQFTFQQGGTTNVGAITSAGLWRLGASGNQGDNGANGRWIARQVTAVDADECMILSRSQTENGNEVYLTFWENGTSIAAPGSIAGGIRRNAGDTAYEFFNASDASLKEDIETWNVDALSSLEQIPVRTYRWKNEEKVCVGFIAQEVQTTIPEAVSPGVDGVLTLGMSSFYPYMIKAIQQLGAENRALRARVEVLENK